jgi:hypothetical protein
MDHLTKMYTVRKNCATMLHDRGYLVADVSVHEQQPRHWAITIAASVLTQELAGISNMQPPSVFACRAISSRQRQQQALLCWRPQAYLYALCLPACMHACMYACSRLLAAAYCDDTLQH